MLKLSRTTLIFLGEETFLAALAAGLAAGLLAGFAVAVVVLRVVVVLAGLRAAGAAFFVADVTIISLRLCDGKNSIDGISC
jgi:hypothetical protein